MATSTTPVIASRLSNQKKAVVHPVESRSNRAHYPRICKSVLVLVESIATSAVIHGCKDVVACRLILKPPLHCGVDAICEKDRSFHL